MLSAALRTTIEILLLRRGPQDMPSSWQLFYVTLGLYVAVNAVVMSLGMRYVEAVVNAAAVSGVLVLYSGWLLKRTGKQLRFAQTLTALLACGLVLSLLAIPCLVGLQPFLDAMRAMTKDSSEMPALPLLPALGYMAVSLWNLIVMGHIYRHAVDTTMGRGLLLALMYEFALFFAVQLAASVLGLGGAAPATPPGS